MYYPSIVGSANILVNNLLGIGAVYALHNTNICTEQKIGPNALFAPLLLDPPNNQRVPKYENGRNANGADTIISLST